MLTSILKSISAYGSSFSLITKLKLWKYFAIPMGISFVTATLIGVSAWGLSDNIGALISKAWIWDWGKATFTTISTVLGGLIVIATGLILYKHIVMALSAPFMSPVSEKIEQHFNPQAVHTHRDTNNAQQLWRGIKINVRNLSMELLLTVPILIMGFIPVIGVFSTVLLYAVQAYYAGFGNMDYTLERHYSYSESISFVKQHRGLAIGNGLIFILFLFIPIIGIILVLPLSVTAASKVTLKQLKQQKNL
jgi:CysZ protein